MCRFPHLQGNGFFCWQCCADAGFFMLFHAQKYWQGLQKYKSALCYLESICMTTFINIRITGVKK